MSVEERLHELGIELPEPPPPAGNYIGAVSVGNLLCLWPGAFGLAPSARLSICDLPRARRSDAKSDRIQRFPGGKGNL